MNTIEILTRIKERAAFKDTEEEKDSYYKELNGITIRISDHKTHMWTWAERYAKKGFPSSMISIVFDSNTTNGQAILKEPLKRGFIVNEYVFPQNMEIFKVDRIIDAIKKCRGTYTNPFSNKPTPIESENPKLRIASLSFNTSTQRWGNEKIWNKTYQDVYSAKKEIYTEISKTSRDFHKIDVYKIITLCPDFLNDCIFSVAHCNEKERTRYGINVSVIKESKQHKNLKRTITESQLRNIVADSIRKVLLNGN